MGAKGDTVDNAVRFGLVIYGLVHLVVAWLIVALALGEHGGSVSTQGALTEVGEQPFGTALLWVVAIGMTTLAGTRLLDLVAGHRADEGRDLWKARAGDLLKAAIYAAVGWKAFRLATGDGGGGGTRVLTARLMDLPLGQGVVGAVGVGILAYGVGNIWRGLSRDLGEKLSSEGKQGTTGTAYLLLGRIGYLAKGGVVGLVGVLFLYAAWTHEPQQSGGLDGVVREILDQPFGTPILVAVGAGIACYAVFALARARHLAR